MSGAVETELRKLEKIVPGLLKTNEKMEMVSFFLNGHKYLKEERIPLNLEPRIDWYRNDYQEEILELTVAYIAELQNHLVGRVRTHGDRTFRKLNKNIRVGANLNEKSSKEEIIKFLHKISSK